MKTLLIFFTSLFPLLGFGQFWLPIPQDVKLIEGRTLLVETDDFVCNSKMVEQLKKYWNLNSSILGKSSEEISALLTLQNAKNYLVLTGDQREEYHKTQGKIERASMISIVLYAGEHAGNRNNLQLDREWICKLSLPSCLVSEIEVQFLARYFSNQMEYVKSLEGGNRKKSSIDPKQTLLLKNKTLLLPQNKLTVSQEEITRYYPAPFQIVTPGTIKSAISSGNNQSAYITVLWSDKYFKWVLTVVNCTDGQILATVKLDGFKPSLVKKSFDEESEFLPLFRSKSQIGLKEIKYLAKEIAKAETK